MPPEELQKKMAQSSTLGSNLQFGGFGNPMGFTPPQRQMGIGTDASRFSSLPAITLNPFSQASIPTFPSSAEIAAPSLNRAQPTDYISGAAAQTGRINIPVSQGTLQATPEQALAFNAPRTPDTASSRTPAQQQALLAQMRIQGAETMRKNLAEQESIIAQRRANPELYTTRSGAKIAAPTNMFGQPIASWQKAYETAGRTNEAALARMGRGVQPATSAQSAPASPSFGVRGIGGVTMPFGTAALSGGPQPSTGFGAGSISRPSQYSNTRAEQRRTINRLAEASNLPRPTSAGARTAYTDYFRQQGLMM